MATATYFWHFLDIIRSKIGRPLLDGLAAMPEKFVALLTAEPDTNPQARVFELWLLEDEPAFCAVKLLAVHANGP